MEREKTQVIPQGVDAIEAGSIDTKDEIEIVREKLRELAVLLGQIV